MARTLSPEVRERILRAAQGLLVDDGLEEFTVEAVAHRSGVAKTTIYRHFSSRQELLIGAVASLIEPVSTPNTGSLRGDLLEFVGRRLPIANDRRLRRLVLGLLDAGERDPDLVPLQDALLRSRTEPLRTIVELALARGEIRPGVGVDLAVDLIQGPLFMRAFVRQEGMTEADLASFVDAVSTLLGSPR